MRLRKRRDLGPLLQDLRYELVPLKGVEEAAAALPRGATATLTCSPNKGQDRSIEVLERLAAQGLQMVPHLAARQVRNDVHLKGIVDRLDRAGVRDVFVIGGDASEEVGAYTSALELLEALSTLDHPFTRIGVAGYPEGHYAIDDETLTQALLAKQSHATYMVTQLCFDSETICRWVDGVRARGVELPCYVGVPGAVDVQRLLRVSMRVGVGDSLRFLRGNRSTALRLLRVTGYRPDVLVGGLVERMTDGRCEISGLHVYTFNQAERSARWVAKAQERARR